MKNWLRRTKESNINLKKRKKKYIYISKCMWPIDLLRTENFLTIYFLILLCRWLSNEIYLIKYIFILYFILFQLFEWSLIENGTLFIAFFLQQTYLFGKEFFNNTACWPALDNKIINHYQHLFIGNFLDCWPVLRFDLTVLRQPDILIHAFTIDTARRNSC